jgi:hypothetical protein
MNFRDIFLTFTFNYCKINCLVPSLSNAAPMVHAPINNFHDLPVPNELLTITPATTLETKYSKLVYRKCTVKNENEQAPPELRNKRLIYPDNPFPRNQSLSHSPNKWQPRFTSHNNRNQPCKSTNPNLYISRLAPSRKTFAKKTTPSRGTASGRPQRIAITTIRIARYEKHPLYYSPILC